jgi:hypothetical protein
MILPTVTKKVVGVFVTLSCITSSNVLRNVAFFTLPLVDSSQPVGAQGRAAAEYEIVVFSLGRLASFCRLELFCLVCMSARVGLCCD